MWLIESIIVDPKWTSLVPVELTVEEIYNFMRGQVEFNELELNIPVCFPTNEMFVAGVKIVRSDRTDILHYIHKKTRFGGVCFQIDTNWSGDVVFVSPKLYEARVVRRAIARLYKVWSPRCESKLRYRGVLFDSIADAAKAAGVPEGTFHYHISQYRNLKRPWPKESNDVLLD